MVTVLVHVIIFLILIKILGAHSSGMILMVVVVDKQVSLVSHFRAIVCLKINISRSCQRQATDCETVLLVCFDMKF